MKALRPDDVWLTPAEIAGLPGLPQTKRGVNMLADEQRWRERDPPRHRFRDGRDGGGGLSYHLSLLPPEAQSAVLSRALVERTRTGAPSSEARTGASRQEEAWSAYAAAKEAHREIARARLALLDRVEVLASTLGRAAAVRAVAAEDGLSASTLWGLFALVEGAAPSDRLALLLPRYKGGGAREEIDPDAWAHIASDWLRPERPAFEACFRRLAVAAEAKGWALPSARTLRRRLEALPRSVKVLARDGAKAAENLVPAQRRSRADLTAMRLVNADGHVFDVFVAYEDGTIGRPVIVAFQDIHSGKVLSWRLDRTENRHAVRLALADLVEAFGVPEACVFDNGRHFASKWLTGGQPNRYRFKVRDEDPLGVLTSLGVTIHWTTPYLGRSKPVERAWRDFCEDIAKSPACAGAYTGNRPDAKPENYGGRAVPIAEFKALVAREIAAHNAREGRRGGVCSGRSFDQVFAESLAAPGTIIRRASPEQRELFLLAVEGVTARSPSGEIHLGGNRYHHEALVDWAGRRVAVRFDPEDLHRGVVVHALDGRLICRAACIDDTGFLDQQAAELQAKAKRAYVSAARRLLTTEKTLDIAEIAEIAAKAAPAPTAPPEPPVVRLVANGGARPMAVRAEHAFAAAVRALDAAEREDADILPFNPRKDPRA